MANENRSESQSEKKPESPDAIAMDRLSQLIGICLTVDFAFKLVVGNPSFPAITLHFLNAVLCQPYGLPRITKITFLERSLDKESADDKLSILDILAEDEFGRRINIEIQTTLPLSLSKRITYYVCTMYTGQLSQGQSYGALQPAVSICVLERALFPNGRLHMDFRLRDRESQVFTDDLQIHLVQLSKSTVTRETVSNASPIEQWGFFLANADRMTEEELRSALPAAEFQQAIGVLKMIASTPDDYATYVRRRKMLFDDNLHMRLVREEAQAEGVEIGRAEGVEIGRAEGEGKGLARGVKIGQINLLRQLLNLPEESSDSLNALSIDELTEMQAALQRKLRERNAQ